MSNPLRGLDDVIAREVLFGKEADGSLITITIEIGRPFLWGDISPTEWACAVRVDPLFSREIHGEGSLQALCQASQMIRTMLNHFQQNGGVLTYETGEEFSLTTHWPMQPY
ncbi:MAG TPA: hypothetical protein VN175_11680 [Rhizomicrobium sp.]|jgi:hypothetical protein|nr:hypothetical protein [Rhizomicrobium sp.]